MQWDGNDMMTTLLSLALYITIIVLVWPYTHECIIFMSQHILLVGHFIVRRLATYMDGYSCECMHLTQSALLVLLSGLKITQRHSPALVVNDLGTDDYGSTHLHPSKINGLSLRLCGGSKISKLIGSFSVQCCLER